MFTDSLRYVCEVVRADPDGPVACFARGGIASRDSVERRLGSVRVAALEHEGWLRPNDSADGRDGVQLTVSLEVFNGLISVLPVEQDLGADYVHVNSDSFWLLDLVWEHASGGTWAAELGIGNGIVAAHLAAKYTRVVGTDLAGPWIRYAQLTLEANEARGRPTGAVVTDVGSGLRRGVFDLVVSNTPWSPSSPVDDDGRAMTFMAGGPTGTELPSRFLLDAADLLAPGGLAILLCFDPTFDDGSRPLQRTLDEIGARGHRVELIDSPIMPPELITPRLQARLPRLRHGAHVAVLIRRP